jgi:hypothetical protein
MIIGEILAALTGILTDVWDELASIALTAQIGLKDNYG